MAKKMPELGELLKSPVKKMNRIGSLDFHLKSLEQFQKMPLPRSGGNLDDLDFDDIQYYVNRLKNGEEPGKRFPRKSRRPLTNWVFRRQNKSFLAVFRLSTNRRLFTTASKKI